MALLHIVTTATASLLLVRPGLSIPRAPLNDLTKRLGAPVRAETTNGLPKIAGRAGEQRGPLGNVEDP